MSDSLEVRWIASLSASALHAARAACRSEALAGNALVAALAEPIVALERELEAAEVPREPFWRHIVPLAAGIESNRQLLERVLARSVGRGPRAEALVGRLAGRVSDLEAAARAAFPNLTDELALRGGPLKEQWEARGPGMMRRLAELVGDDALVGAADVALVPPVCGGGGRPSLDYSVVVFEAVLANAILQLPEVVRLAWMMAQLRMNAPVFSEAVPAPRIERIAALAMLPPTLAAAEHVELSPPLEHALPLAIERWGLADAGGDLAHTLSAWWETYLASRPPWSVALTALDKMVG
jgi:hypothetical protein